jgi:hypothetical protein
MSRRGFVEVELGGLDSLVEFRVGALCVVPLSYEISEGAGFAVFEIYGVKA